MPFLRRQLNGEKEPDRTQTGALAPPEPGIAQSEEGIIVGSLEEQSAIKAGTEVFVTLPGPREAVLDARGNMTPRWFRFFQELHRRTGGTQDNVNFVGTFRLLGLTAGQAAFTSEAPSVEITNISGSGSLTLGSDAPNILVA